MQHSGTHLTAAGKLRETTETRARPKPRSVSSARETTIAAVEHNRKKTTNKSGTQTLPVEVKRRRSLPRAGKTHSLFANSPTVLSVCCENLTTITHHGSRAHHGALCLPPRAPGHSHEFSRHPFFFCTSFHASHRPRQRHRQRHNVAQNLQRMFTAEKTLCPPPHHISARRNCRRCRSCHYHSVRLCRFNVLLLYLLTLAAACD